MSLFNKTQLEGVARTRASLVRKSLSEIAAKEITESTTGVLLAKKYDIFLSHRYLDYIHIIGLQKEITDLGLSVFVDWIVEPDLDRSEVSIRTADWLRSTMKRCQCLPYAFSTNSSESKWMAWELGYSDAYHGKVAIIPITDYDTHSNNYDYSGEEYLKLYPYVTIANDTTGTKRLWIHTSPKTYISLLGWLDGKEPHT